LLLSLLSPLLARPLDFLLLGGPLTSRRVTQRAILLAAQRALGMLLRTELGA
jgi:hypothetical protein